MEGKAEDLGERGQDPEQLWTEGLLRFLVWSYQLYKVKALQLFAHSTPFLLKGWSVD